MKGMTYERFREIFSNLEDWKKIQLWNDLCDDYAYEETIYNMDDLDDLLEGKKPSELLTMADDDFNYCDDYFYFNAYGHICSVDDFDEFVNNGRGDLEEIYEWLESHDRLQDFAEEYDPDYDDEDWEDEDEEEEDEE